MARWRFAEGLTQGDLAEKAGVDRITVWRYETGRVKRPSMPVCVRIVRALGAPGDDIWREVMRLWPIP